MIENNELAMNTESRLSFDEFRKEVLNDYRLACESREVSVLARKEVLTGKAKFGIFGDGKEVAQIAMSKYFKPGDFRSGYYRDQTVAFATGIATPEQFFSQLYADPDLAHDPFSGGRQMNSHFATPNIDKDGNWLNLADMKNSAADMAPTAAQMPRSLGLAYASKLFREVPVLHQFPGLSNNGNEICFTTIGDASTSEGHFWETINAAGVLQVPMAVFVWDDGYGISVPRKFQTTKNSISAALEGFRKTKDSNGFDIYNVKGWDYAGMCEVFETAIQKIRDTHVPALFHVEEITQPQGHSTSGSHERYKSKERLAWEREFDCNLKMRSWILENALADEETLNKLEAEAKASVQEAKRSAWEKYLAPIKEHVQSFAALAAPIANLEGADATAINVAIRDLQNNREPQRRDILKTTANILLRHRALSQHPLVQGLQHWYDNYLKTEKESYNSFLYATGANSALNVPEVPVAYDSDSIMVNGYEILNRYFDQLFTHNPKVFAFGEDVGKIGDVNQGFAGLQQKHGKDRISDTGIRELTIMGQGIGMALRGLRPIAEIQYLDYLLYGLQPLSDDVASLQYRTKGVMHCPLIVRTRGHRLEGIWHSGSPMGMIINSLRGMHVCVPRNMVQAAGMYNTLLRANEPAIVIESLNGYRLKEKLPSNLETFTVPLGIPEVLKAGDDITIVTYGSTVRIVEEAVNTLNEVGISCEIIDVQTLLPFDINHSIVESLKKTSRILFVDEDVPGGGTAYMFQEVIEKQGGYRWLDVAPRTLSAQAHRPAYGSDGDYFSKPNTEDVVSVIMDMMRE
ncbi:Pyruvate/2-oxoglutarate/acetoin dehydrogenase complex, dehydrogenase (E1) component [Chitinophaga terrae (ex Kim and Jung 2007)]|uniref:3-methyl-2-oxobutanoate dehydrogenase (2-methylpropanoyl-transferring) n=1 Tax=Chitinophaga terrae (ex Kim and Jung 2007) TaxID=408074 RepID=A0A1H4A879_9BACT|nr:alpha-ketoacid dehydrogenase subunit alpha/beta [Chitinophaga terrae (ex Kim and Jung 2007)]MDQ0105970.1 pyruvate/2-oxoglutarate/acetoin dehydrogenase E1 component/TPP-dependent pyruvate/acetoin dehydrogenase alpha subunit [Chitinophaga terrae (ex Kim and Jung 2007)]GEP90101.1 transketolase [Chitinophaga terrae (ex Kim and Jung 2007)]SEA32189.1 Pyruvate/2-oxoglutarate/acetoin dehydrogenase complex, dehydrogenase (E1) component [Chitinophaga terrae (ex Kim and Jung 2007)]